MSLVAAHEAQWALALVFRGVKPPPLQALEEGSLKQAFRRRARDTHPDRAAIRGRSEAELAKDFKDLRRAYETLLTWLTQGAVQRAAFRSRPRRPATTRRPAPPKPRPQTKRSPPPPPPPRGQQPDPRSGASTSSRQQKSSASAWWEARQARQAQLGSFDRSSGGSRFAALHMDLGSLPRRSLLFAEFLHLSRLISWQDRIAAIIWQRQQRPSIGKLAQEWGYLQDWQVESLLRHKRGGERFGEAAVRLGLLTTFQRQVLLGGQQRSQQPIGCYFVEAGILTQFSLKQALAAYKEHNRRYGTAI